MGENWGIEALLNPDQRNRQEQKAAEARLASASHGGPGLNRRYRYSAHGSGMANSATGNPARPAASPDGIKWINAPAGAQQQAGPSPAPEPTTSFGLAGLGDAGDAYDTGGKSFGLDGASVEQGESAPKMSIGGVEWKADRVNSNPETKEVGAGNPNLAPGYVGTNVNGPDRTRSRYHEGEIARLEKMGALQKHLLNGGDDGIRRKIYEEAMLLDIARRQEDEAYARANPPAMSERYGVVGGHIVRQTPDGKIEFVQPPKPAAEAKPFTHDDLKTESELTGKIVVGGRINPDGSRVREYLMMQDPNGFTDDSAANSKNIGALLSAEFPGVNTPEVAKDLDPAKQIAKDYVGPSPERFKSDIVTDANGNYFGVGFNPAKPNEPPTKVNLGVKGPQGAAHGAPGKGALVYDRDGYAYREEYPGGPTKPVLKPDGTHLQRGRETRQDRAAYERQVNAYMKNNEKTADGQKVRPSRAEAEAALAERGTYPPGSSPSDGGDKPAHPLDPDGLFTDSENAARAKARSR